MNNQRENTCQDKRQTENPASKHHETPSDELPTWLILIIASPLLLPVVIVRYSAQIFMIILNVFLILLPFALMAIVGLLGYSIIIEFVSSWIGYVAVFSLLAIIESFIFVIGMAFIIEVLIPELKPCLLDWELR